MNIEERIQKLEDLIKIQSQDGNWNYDPYMHGLANGLILALATLKGKEPKYLDAPKEWLCNKEIVRLEKADSK